MFLTHLQTCLPQVKRMGLIDGSKTPVVKTLVLVILVDGEPKDTTKTAYLTATPCGCKGAD